MNKKTAAVIFGGCSPEYDVSLNSAYSIINALDRNKYDIILLGITRDGIWFRFSGDIEQIRDDTWHCNPNLLKTAVISPSRTGCLLEFSGDRAVSIPIDVVFPVLHGKFGEDGTVQGLCELAGIPVVGCGTAASALCMDKDRAHKIVSLAGIKTPKSITFTAAPTEETLVQTAQKLKLPLFIKPVKAGSSFGITKIDDYSQLAEAVKAAFLYDDTVIIEENINGFEAGCAVVGNLEPHTGRIDEIELSHGFFDFMEKYSLKTSKIHMPARITEENEQRLQKTAVTIYRALGCRGYARVDMFLTPEGEIVFNEVNTIPGFTGHSRFPNMMKGVGVDFPQLVDMLIGLALGNENSEGGQENE